MGFQDQNTTLILSKSKILQFISMQEAVLLEREILMVRYKATEMIKGKKKGKEREKREGEDEEREK